MINNELDFDIDALDIDFTKVNIDEFDADKIDYKLFDVIEFGGFEKSRICKAKTVKEIPNRNIKSKYAIDLAKEVAGKIALDTQHRILLSGAFIFCDFIEALIKENDWHIKTMYISTLGLSYENVDTLHGLLADGWVDELNLIVSNGFYNRDYHTLVKYMYQMLDIENMSQIAIAGNHTKDCIFEIEGGGFISIEGSANLRTSACIEKIFITESESDYLWNKEYMDKIINQYKTINKDVENTNKRFKGLRVNKLWNAITK